MFFVTRAFDLCQWLFVTSTSVATDNSTSALWPPLCSVVYRWLFFVLSTSSYPQTHLHSPPVGKPTHGIVLLRCHHHHHHQHCHQHHHRHHQHRHQHCHQHHHRHHHHRHLMHDDAGAKKSIKINSKVQLRSRFLTKFVEGMVSWEFMHRLTWRAATKVWTKKNCFNREKKKQ